MQNAGRNIVNHKHANAREIRRHLLQSRLYLYPTRHFDETCCISALEASAAGVPIVATARAALLERVDTYTTGYLVWDDEAHDKVFINDTVRLLKEDALWQKMSEASIRQAQQFDYATIVDAWLERWRDALDVRR